MAPLRKDNTIEKTFDCEAETLCGDFPDEVYENTIRSTSLAVRSCLATFKAYGRSAIEPLQITEATSERFAKPRSYFVSTKVRAKALISEVI